MEGDPTEETLLSLLPTSIPALCTTSKPLAARMKMIRNSYLAETTLTAKTVHSSSFTVPPAKPREKKHQLTDARVGDVELFGEGASRARVGREVRRHPERTVLVPVARREGRRVEHTRDARQPVGRHRVLTVRGTRRTARSPVRCLLKLVVVLKQTIEFRETRNTGVSIMRKFAL